MLKKKIGIVGYFGFGNYGDELFVSAYKKFFYDCDVTVMHDSINAPFYAENLEEKIASLDAIIVGGGDLIIPNSFPHLYFDQRFLVKPIFYHGIGVPQWIGENPAVIDQIRPYLQHDNVKKINVRDVESMNWINEKMKPKIQLDQSADMVFSLDYRLPETKNPKKKVFGLILRKFTADPNRWVNVKKLCDRAIALGYEIKNIILATGQTRDDDLESMSSFQYDNMTTVSPNDIDDLTLEIGSCDVIASMKFHGIVVSYAYGIPAITLSTTDKFVNLCRWMDRADLIGHVDHADLPDRLSKFMPSIPATTRKLLKADARDSMMELRRRVLNEVD